MNRVYRLTCMVVGLVCLLGGTPSWAQSWNPTASDSNGNTAGGSFALERHLTSDSFFNTAFGWGALEFNTVADNTAMGSSALGNNSTGEQNTAIGSGALQGNRTGSYNTASGYLALY